MKSGNNSRMENVARYEATENKLTQINAMFQIILENIFSFDTIELKEGTREELEKAAALCASYPTWREALQMLNENISDLRDEVANYAFLCEMEA